ncbi:hypothetical protein [Roseateles sp. PN1]
MDEGLKQAAWQKIAGLRKRLRSAEKNSGDAPFQNQQRDQGP